MKINVGDLRALCAGVLTNAGMPEAEAEIFSEMLVHADRRGVRSHGVMAFERYVSLIENGNMAKKFKYTAVADNPAIAVWDAHRSCGHVSGYYAMKEAIKKAGTYGIGFVGVRNSSHFGAGAYYSLQAAEAGMIGIVSSTAGPTMAPWGGKERKIGNNPLSLSAPASKHPVVTLDMAQSVVAMGKINIYRNQGIEALPAGWAFDKDGNPTEKTEDAYSVVPIAAYKGFGLSLFIDIISGILIGGATGERCGDAASGPSHTFAAIEPSAFGLALDEFKKQLGDRIDEFKSSPKKDGVDQIYMPGEPEEINYANAQNEVEVYGDVIEQLNALANRYGCKPLAAV